MLIFDPAWDGVRWYQMRGGQVERSGLLEAGTNTLPVELQEAVRRADRLVYVLPQGGNAWQALTSPLDTDGLKRIEAVLPLLPTLNGQILHLMETGLRHRPEASQQVLCETAFFRDLPAAVRTYGLAYEDRSNTLRRYGAGGLAHAWAWQRARRHAPALRSAVSVCLGDYPSVAAIMDGKAVETSGGFSPLDGIPSRTGCGELDPAAVLRLCEVGIPAVEIEYLLTRQSGWQALNGQPMTWEDLLGSPESLAIENLIHHVVSWIGGCLAALGGAELIVFNVPDRLAADFVIERICQRLSFLEGQVGFLILECHRSQMLYELCQQA